MYSQLLETERRRRRQQQQQQHDVYIEITRVYDVIFHSICFICFCYYCCCHHRHHHKCCVNFGTARVILTQYTHIFNRLNTLWCVFDFNSIQFWWLARVDQSWLYGCVHLSWTCRQIGVHRSTSRNIARLYRLSALSFNPTNRLLPILVRFVFLSNFPFFFFFLQLQNTNKFAQCKLQVIVELLIIVLFLWFSFDFFYQIGNRRFSVC